jgi:hypothetical protein
LARDRHEVGRRRLDLDLYGHHVAIGVERPGRQRIVIARG